MRAPSLPTRLSLLAVLLVLSGSSVASADPLPSVNLRSFAPSTSAGASLFLEPVNVGGHLNFNTAGWLSWAYRPLVVRQGGEITGKVVSRQLALDATASLGLGKFAEVGVLVPMVLEQGGDRSPQTEAVLGGGSIPAQAFGDVMLTGKATLKPVGELGGFGLAVVGRVSLPLGSRSSGIGEGALTTELRMLAEMRLVAVSFQGTAGFKLRNEEREFVGKTWGDEIPWGAGIFVKPQMFGFDAKGRWNLGVEAHGSLPAGPDSPFTSVAQTPAYVGATARYAVMRDVTLLGGLETGLTRAAGSTPARLVLALAWSPREHDRDHDGVDDDKDECPDLPEDRDGFQDSDGCPEGDNDEDNVPDDEDKCPLEPEDEDGFEDEDGCPDPDNDQDGIPDEQDRCPNEAGPATSDPATNGCPVRDTDGDGLMDDVDKCPDEAEDKDGFQDEDGCPDPDNDQDGILDVDDACPNEKGVASEDPKRHGCPSADRDQDGIPNEQDKCPDQAETYNGFEDEDGCPEPESPRHKPLAQVVEKKGEKQLQITRPVRFKGESTELEAASEATLRAVGRLLVDRPRATVVVAVRAGQKAGGEELARQRAALLVSKLRAVTGRAASAKVAGWDKAKPPAGGAVTGVGLTLIDDGEAAPK